MSSIPAVAIVNQGKRNPATSLVSGPGFEIVQEKNSGKSNRESCPRISRINAHQATASFTCRKSPVAMQNLVEGSNSCDSSRKFALLAGTIRSHKLTVIAAMFRCSQPCITGNGLLRSRSRIRELPPLAYSKRSMYSRNNNRPRPVGRSMKLACVGSGTAPSSNPAP